MAFDLKKIRGDFPILSRSVYGKPLVYLDNAATSQKPRCVIDGVAKMYSEFNSNVHRSVHFLSGESTALYEDARETVRRFLNAPSREEIIFTSGATAAINTVAYSYGQMAFSKGDNIVVTEMEHHSNIVPWQIVCERLGVEIRVLPFADDGSLILDRLPELLDDRTRLVAVTQASNVLGTVTPLRRIIDAAHAAGAAVLVDGCQGIVHGGADVRDLDCDFYVFSGHKLYGPTGTGVLYGKRELLERMPPFMGGGDMIWRVSFGKTAYAELPMKFEAGTANYIGATGLAEAIRYIERIGVSDIAVHERALLSYATERLLAIEGLTVYGNLPDKCSIISFNVDGVHNSDIGEIVDKTGVAIRSGRHCTDPLMDHYGVPGMCRASFAFYNTLEEADILAEGVRKAVRMLRR